MEQNGALRPTRAEDFVGQKRLLARLRIHTEAAVAEQRPLEHVLLFGPPGFGKTTLAGIIADMLGDDLYGLCMPVKPPALLRFLQDFKGGCVLLDELHRATQAQQEDLLTLLEDGYITTPAGRKVHVAWFTAIGATTEPEKVIPAVYDRFAIKPNFDPYTLDELKAICTGMAAGLGFELGEADAVVLARAAGGTPRNCKSLVKTARDLQIAGERHDGAAVLELCQVTADGLTQDHLAYLQALKKMGKPTGIKTLANMLRMNDGKLADDERLLIALDLIAFTESGREITEDGRAKLAALAGETNELTPLERRRRRAA